MLETIISALFSYLSSVWTMTRVLFSTLDVPLMTNCLQLLGVVILIGIIDNLPEIFSRRRKKLNDDDDEYEYIRVRRK